MRKLLAVIAFALSITISHAQTISYDDFKSIIPSLQKEDWSSAFNTSKNLLEAAPNDSSDFKAIVIYINIFSAAGMVTEGKMTYDELEQNIMKFKGQRILMSAHPVSENESNTLNQTMFSEIDSHFEGFTSATNAKGTNIFCFEKFYFNDKLNLKKLKKSIVRCGGTLDKIELNPNKSMIWIVRLTVTDAYVRIAN